MALPFAIPEAERRLLPEGRFTGPVPWMLAVMIFLTVLAAAGGLGLRRAAGGLAGEIGNRLTIQVVEPNPEVRDAQAERVESAVARVSGVENVRRVPQAEVARLLEPWLGEGGLDADLPVPALLDVDLASDGNARAAVAQAARSITPTARVDDSAAWLGSLAGLLGALGWLALALVLLMAAASAAAVILAARGALDTHRTTIEVMHLMGSTDLQVARLFQRRIALDALFGGALGFAGAIAVLLLLGRQVASVGSELLGSAGLSPLDWALLVLIPVAGVALATLVARITVLRALEATL